MVRIRLRRVGAKNQPSYRVVVTDSRSPRDGRFIESIGFYNPRTEPETFQLDEARALHWLNNGAQPSDSVIRLMKTHGTYARYERLRAGESLEDLVAEAEGAAAVAEAPSRTTRRPAPEAAPAVPEAEDAHTAEEVEEVEAEVEEEPAAEAEAEEAEASVEEEAEEEAETEETEAEETEAE